MARISRQPEDRMECGLAAPRVLVFGWYGDNHNLGDLFFRDAFQTLFPQYHFTFTDILSAALLNGVDAVFFGGGSFLDQASTIPTSLLPALFKLPIFYLGIGAETDIHPTHASLLQSAKLVTVRSKRGLDKIRALNNQVTVTSDLVYAARRIDLFGAKPQSKSVLFLPNIACIPKHSDPHFQHVFWDAFKQETAQFLDALVEDGHNLAFFPMCQNPELDDTWAAVEIMGRMQHRSVDYLLPRSSESLAETLRIFAQFETIITQRFHGKVLADLAQRPCVTIAHHDKLQVSGAIPYFGLNKTTLQHAFQTCKPDKLPLNSDIYERSIVKQVQDIVVEGLSGGSICRS